MKIAIPVEGDRAGARVCTSYGRAPFYLIHDTETKENHYVVNEAARQTGGAGIKAAQIVVDQGVDALLSPRLGQNAADVIQAAGIAIFKTQGDSVDENLRLYARGLLEELDEIHAGLHGN